MAYNPENQYRCTIIRGKSQTDMEDLLPLYANIVHRFAPCEKEAFFESAGPIVAKYLTNTTAYSELTPDKVKTIRNHITEMGSANFGLFYTIKEDETEYVIETDSCKQLCEKSDFPLFFKNLCLNFQFPNGTMAKDKFLMHYNNGVHLKPYCFVIALLYYAQTRPEKVLLKQQEIGYYALNNLDVLQGNVSYVDVYNRIIEDRKSGIKRNKLSASRDWQHIREQFNMLELANLIETDYDNIWLNKNEEAAIKVFVDKLNDFRFPDFSAFDLTKPGVYKNELTPAWRKSQGYFNPELSNMRTEFNASENEIVDGTEMKKVKGAIKSTTDLGDEGEALVYRIEQERVRNYKERLVNKVLMLGKTKGLGYDISSIEANESPKQPEFARYIEVKATKRTTEPNFDNVSWSDTLNLTTKEWTAAQQFGDSYNIYRVYFTKTKTFIVRIQNPFKKAEEGKIEVFPTIYQMNFGSDVIEKRYAGE